MGNRKQTEAISEYVLKRIDSQNGIVGTVLCIVTFFMGVFIHIRDGIDSPGTSGLFGIRQPLVLLLMGATVFAGLIFILSKNDDKISNTKRHFLSTIAITVFDIAVMAFSFLYAGIDMAGGHGAMNFAIALLLVFGAMIYPFWISIIVVPAMVVSFVPFIYWFAGALSNEAYRLSASEAVDLCMLGIIVMIISIMNSSLQKKRFEAEAVYYNNIKTLLASRPNAFSTLRVNVTRDEVYENIGTGIIADELQGAGSIEEIIKRFESISPSLSEGGDSSFFTRGSLLKVYEEGRDFLSFNWNYELESGKYGWVTSNIRLIKNPATKDIEAIVCSEMDNRRHTESRIHSILSNLEYIQIATIDVKKRTVSLYSSQGMINDGAFPDRDYDEETKEIIHRLSAETAGGVAVSGRMLALDTIVRMLSEKEVYQVHFEVKGKHYQESFRYLDEFKRTILMTVQDITDLLCEEEEKSRSIREALEKARESSRMKGEVISKMSHDIKTPMSSIIGFSSLLEHDRNAPERILSDAKNILSAGNELLAIVNDVLDFAKLSSNENGLSEKEFSLERTVRRVSEAAKALAEPRGIGFSEDFSDVAHESFIGDDERISQILSNIIIFLMNRTGKGGNISLSVKARPHPSGREENISFEIAGREVVLSKEYQDVIFEPFSRVEDEEDKRPEAEGKGNIDTGLGLPISKTLTELMGGNIYVKSGPEGGSVFSVIIPLAFTAKEPLSVDPETAGEERDVFDGLKILAAEDNELNAVLLRELMAMKGAHTEIRADGEQVLNEFKYSPAGKFDVILMDVQMPVMNGHEAARAIRALESDMSLPAEKRREAAAIPIIAMTANTFPEDVVKSLNAGMNGHVGKPIDIRALGEAIRKSF